MVSYFTVLGVVIRALPKTSIIFFVGFLAFTLLNAIVSFRFRRKNFLFMFRRSKDRRKMNYYSDMLVNKDMVKEIRLLTFQIY